MYSLTDTCCNVSLDGSNTNCSSLSSLNVVSTIVVVVVVFDDDGLTLIFIIRNSV